MRIAYSVNQYPAVSHSFVRREILEFERSGVHMVRLALLRWTGTIADDADERESEQPFHIRKLGVWRLCTRCLAIFLSSPLRRLQATALVAKMARRSGGAFAVHCFYLPGACAVADILKRQDVHHVHAHFGTNSPALLNATALVLPSLAEGLPVAIMEAMALRPCVLSTYIAGIPELVSTGVSGWLVPSGSAQALAAAMESCLSASPADIEKMDKAAQRIVLERHDIACETRKLAAHFLQVVGERAHALGR